MRHRNIVLGSALVWTRSILRLTLALPLMAFWSMLGLTVMSVTVFAWYGAALMLSQLFV